MAKPKYTLKFSHIDQKHGIHKLERDGFTRHDIHRVLYAEGVPKKREAEKLISNLYDRKE